MDELAEMVYHPRSGSVCLSYELPQVEHAWEHIFGTEHGRIVCCRPHREMGIQLKKGIEHLRAVLPAHATAEVKDGKIVVTLGAH